MAWAQSAPEPIRPEPGRAALPSPVPVTDLGALVDSIASAPYRELAERATGFRLVVSLADRRLWLINGADTLRTEPLLQLDQKSARGAYHRWKGD